MKKLFIIFALLIFSSTFLFAKSKQTLPQCDIPNAKLIDLYDYGLKELNNYDPIKLRNRTLIKGEFSFYGYSTKNQKWVLLKDAREYERKIRFLALTFEDDEISNPTNVSIELFIETYNNYGTRFLINVEKIEIEGHITEEPIFETENLKASKIVHCKKESSAINKIDKRIKASRYLNPFTDSTISAEEEYEKALKNYYHPTLEKKYGLKLVLDDVVFYSEDYGESLPYFRSEKYKFVKKENDDVYFIINKNNQKKFYKNDILIYDDIVQVLAEKDVFYSLRTDNENTYSIYKNENPIIQNLDYVREFIVSPNGEIAYSTGKIVYRNGKKIFTATNDWDISDMCFSPDGSKFYFLESIDFGYYRKVNLKGSNLWGNIVMCQKPDFGSFIFSDDSKYVAIHTEDGDGFQWIIRNDKALGPFQKLNSDIRFENGFFVYTYLDQNSGIWKTEREKLK